ncbi:ankyrin repeat domain-containing protein 36C-like [Sciurus carolinensis]|uniref:ankyrin repeat domain-containing protein 36C-like n=1 Tax=Sciurus carolinensis TaxID=30640 RepID=UPI001FB48D81|nr:ankyrin repeat domain-containing protein 36C-like [Sciurus carolinensis]
MTSRRKTFAAFGARPKVDGYNPIGSIHKAARHGDLKGVRRLLVRGGCHVNDIDKKNRQEEQVIECASPAAPQGRGLREKAIQQQEEECVTILLENGADLNVQDPNGETPLHHAVYTDNTSIAAKLLSHNANIEAQNKDGHTPLLLALKENKHHMAEFLIKAKANVHAVDNRGRTALMLAVRYESPGIIKLLIEEGVDIFAEDKNGGTALCYSVASGYNICSDKPGPSDSTPDEGNNQSDTKNVAEDKELYEDFQQSSKDEAKSVTGTQENKTVFDHGGTECQKEDKAGVNFAQSISIKHSYKPSFSATNSKHLSGDDNQGEQKIGKHVEDVGSMSSHMGGSRNDMVAKSEDTTIDSVSMSSKEPHSDVTPEDGAKTLHGTKKKWTKSSSLTESRNENMAKPEDTGIDSVPMSPKECHSDVTPEDREKTLHGTKKKRGKRSSGNAKQGREQRIKEYVEECHSDVTPEDREKILHGTKKKRTKRSSGKAKQGGEQRIKECVEDVGLMSSPLAESRNDSLAKPEHTGINSVPMSPKEPHSDVTPENGSKTLHGTEKKHAKEMQDYESVEGDVSLMSFPLAESGNDNLDKPEDTGIDSVPMSPKESHSDVTPEDPAKTHGTKKKRAKRSSGKAKQGGEQRIKEHVKDVGLMSSLLAESRNDNLAKAEDTEINSVPMSHKESHSDVTPEDPAKKLHGTKKKWAKLFQRSSDNDKQGGEQSIKEHVKDVGLMSSPLAESRNDNMAKPEDSVIDSVPISPKGPSGKAKQGGEQRIKEYVKDVSLMSSPLAESGNDNLAKPEDTGINSVPMSPKESHSDVTPEDQAKTLHGGKKKRAKRSSGKTKQGGEQRIKEHVKDMGLMSSPLVDSRNDNMAKSEDTEIDSMPMSPKEPQLDVTPEDGAKTLHGTKKKKWAKLFQRSSDNDKQGGEQSIKEYVKDVGLMSSPLAESRNDNMAKPEDTGIDSVPISTKETHSDVTPENGSKTLHGAEKKHAKHSSGDANLEAEKINTYIEDVDLMSSLAESRNDNLAKAEDTEFGSVPMSPKEPYSDVTPENGTKSLHVSKKKRTKVTNQINAMEDLDESQSPLTASQVSEVAYPNCRDIWMLFEQPSMSYKDSHSLPKIKKAVDSCQRIELEKSHPSQGSLPLKEVAKLENKLCVLKEELSEMENAKSKLEQKEIKWKQELCNLRDDLKEKEKKLRDFDQLCEKMNNQLREIEEKYEKEVELNKELQLFSGSLKTELETARNNLNKVSTRKETEKELLHKYHILEDRFAMIRLEMEKMNHQNQEDKKEYLEVIDSLREKNDDLQRTIKLNEETLTKTTFQYNEQIDILKTEITKLKFKLENKEQNTERQETEVKSYPASQAVAALPCNENQTSKRELELPSQRATDGCLGLKDKENFKISKLNVGSEILSQKFSKSGIKVILPEKKFCSHMRRDLRKVIMTLKQVVLRQSEEELTDNQTEESQSEVLSKHSSRYHLNTEDGIQDLKKILDQVVCQTHTATSNVLEELKYNEVSMIKLMQRRIDKLQYEIQMEEHDEFHVEEYKVHKYVKMYSKKRA